MWFKISLQSYQKVSTMKNKLKLLCKMNSKKSLSMLFLVYKVAQNFNNFQ